MFWYIVISILMLYPLSIVLAGKRSGKRTECVALLSGCLILWFFMAMRDVSVGVDTKYYSHVFTQFADIPLSRVFTAVTYATSSNTWTFDFEPGYRLLNKVVSWFSDSPQAITIVNSTLIMALLYRFIRRESPDYLLSLWLFLTLGVYQTEMNVTRNAIAILLVYSGMSYVRNRQFGKYLCLCLLAAAVHQAAVVFIPVYWLVHNYSITAKRGAALLVGSCVLGLVFPVLSPYFQMLVPDSLDRYFAGDTTKTETIIVGLLYAGLFVVCCLMMTKSERSRICSQCSVGILMWLINLCLFGLNIGLADAARMAALFGPYIIVFLPQMLNLIESPIRRQYATAILAGLCGCQFILRMCINNIGGTMPYQFFWQ